MVGRFILACHFAWLCPMYFWAVVYWRVRYKRWAFVEPLRYAQACRNHANNDPYWISLIMWLLNALFIVRLLRG